MYPTSFCTPNKQLCSNKSYINNKHKADLVPTDSYVMVLSENYSKYVLCLT